MTGRLEGRRLLVSGASGLLGSALTARAAAEGADVVKLVRRPVTSTDEVQWDPAANRLDASVVEGVDVVVHLSGAVIVGKRWSARRRAVLRSSRIDSARLLADAIGTALSPPDVFLSGSAIGYYGSRGDEVLTEASGPGDLSPGAPAAFLAQLCIDWEAATLPAGETGTRVVNLRSGLVLDGRRGVLKPLLPLFRAGLGGKLSDGSQWMSWIAIDDHVAALIHLMDSGLSGSVNIVAPNPVRNTEFTETLGALLHRPTVLRVPGAALHARLGREEAQGSALASLRVIPECLVDDGFDFSYPELEGALGHMLVS